MILTAHQPTYLPWLGLFHKIALADAFCLFDTVQLEHYSFEYRNKIKTANGPIWLSVPLKVRQHFDRQANEIEINYSRDWRKKHWRSILLNYSKTPHFHHYADWLENIYQQEWKTLHELNTEMLLQFMKYLELEPKFYRASDLKLAGSKSDLVLEMCQKLGASTFIFGKLGRDYVKTADFAQEKIMLYFQDYKHPTYNQLYTEFEPYMSIIDLLFNEGPRSKDIIMRGNISKKQLPQ